MVDVKNRQLIKKTQILNAAKHRIQVVGYKTATIDTICTDCGISKKTFYVFFKTKEDLLFALIDREFENDKTFLEKEMEKISNPVEQIRAFIRFMVEFLQKDLFNVNFMMQAADRGSQHMRERYTTYMDEKSMTLAIKYIENGRKQGYFKGVTDVKIYAYGMVKLFTAFTYSRSISFERSKEERGYYTDVLANMIIQSLSSEAV